MSASIPITLERDNVNDESVTLIRWFVKQGERVEAGSLLAEIETSKANVEVHAPAAGYLAQEYSEGAEIPAISAIGRIVQMAPAEQASCAKSLATPGPAGSISDQMEPADAPGKQIQDVGIVLTSNSSSPHFVAKTEYRQRFSPLANRMMEIHGLTAADFAGLSVVRKQDVLDRLSPTAVEPESQAKTATAVTSTPITQPYREVPISKMKRKEGAALAAGVRNALSSAVSVTCFTRGLRCVLEEQTGPGSASAVIVYEVSRLLRKYPSLNSSFRGDRTLQYEQVNIGYAMDDGRGLKVAVLHECDARSVQQITAQLRDLTVAYLTDKLTPAQIVNATFTISDLSGVGVTDFLPLISENQGGILGVGAEQFAPDGVYGAYTLTLTFDHQIANGRIAALFLGDLKERLQGYEEAAPVISRRVACSRCGRTAGELTSLNHFLLRSVVPEGYVCTLCASGY